MSQQSDPPSYEESNTRHRVTQKGRPTVVAASTFNASWDAIALKKAIIKMDKKRIAMVLCKRSLAQRIEIVRAYKTNVGKNLASEIQSKVGGRVKNLLLSLLVTIPELYCQQLRKTRNEGFIESVATTILSFPIDLFESEKRSDDEVLIEIMCTKSNSEIRKICATYQQLFGKRLEQSIREEKSGKFKRLLKLLSAGERDESAITDQKAAKADAEILRKSFAKQQTCENMIIDILCVRSFNQIKVINDEYKKLYGTCLEKDIKQNTSDTLKDGLLAIIRTSNSQAEFYARRINKGINNFLLDDRTLGRLIVVRCENDLTDIKNEFNRIFRKPIKSSLKDEISGSYKHTLLLLLAEN